MKKQSKTPYIVFPILVLLLLAIIAVITVREHKTATDNLQPDLIPADQLFVPIQVDTLNTYLKLYFDRGGLVTSKKDHQFVIEYNPQSLILLHANNNKMIDARKYLENAQLSNFSIKYDKGKVKITMRKDGDYVDCPALIVAEILRKSNGQ